ncbi:hypothetical protein CEXT_289281 [Caerostris extrusa]|uniref:Uncharacterized protein n=1 Tax=Caerostris extrusa TaxID=172846 RepID=A0AAV4RNL2_CAEEX|nr:hypothetical protein CEXT_289281 [Caerostris extrusa]
MAASLSRNFSGSDIKRDYPNNRRIWELQVSRRVRGHQRGFICNANRPPPSPSRSRRDLRACSNILKELQYKLNITGHGFISGSVPLTVQQWVAMMYR